MSVLRGYNDHDTRQLNFERFVNWNAPHAVPLNPRFCKRECVVMHGNAPSLVPSFDVTVYLVLDDFGKIGRAYREADEEASDLETIITNMLNGEYTKPLRVVAFNTAEGWARDVSEDVAWEVVRRASSESRTLPEATHDFATFHIGEREVLRELS
jgi:hypothetical protein